MQKFRLSDTFIEQYKDKQPAWGPLGKFIYLRTYSRFIEEENRNERWWETVRRVVEGTFSVQKEHCAKLRLPWKNPKAQKSAQIMYDKIFSFKFLPPGRGLWMMGTKFVEERGSAPLFNCAFVSTHDIDTRGSFAFCWTMDALMLGVGVGVDIKGADKITVKEPKPPDDTLIYTIPDSREGWVESVELLIDAFFQGKKLPKFDYSNIRPFGELIKGFGGIASGPGPLKDLHKNIKKLLSSRTDNVLSSTDIVDMMNFIGVCVVAGNVRRSAEIMLGDYTDTAYVTMKDSKKHSRALKTHRWASNNSIFVEINKTDYSKFVDNVATNGEPGFVWLENIRKYGRLNDKPNWIDKDVWGINPCGEIPLESTEMCNLVETFPSLHDTYEEYQETLKYAYLYSKTVTLIPTHWPESNAVMMKNRRIGTSQSGIIDAYLKHGRSTMSQWCDNGYKYLKNLDEIYSNWLCVPKSKKITTVKPSGSVSQLPGVSPGIHYPHSEYYIRRVRISTASSLVVPMKEAGYNVVQEQYGTEETKKNTVVVEFPVYEKNFSRRKEDVTIWEQVKNAVDYQRYWADNNVSITVTFKESEADDLVRVLEAYEDQLKAVSFLPLKHNYELAPYEEITKEEYERMNKKIKPADFSHIVSEPIGERYCENDSCELPIGN